MFGFSPELLGERLGIRCKDGGFRFGLERLVRSNRVPRKTRRLRVEPLEERALMAAVGVDYVVEGLKWSNPSRITYSIAPDGVYWSHGTNTLNATFNSTIGGNGVWQREIARALATWQSVADINIVQVADGPYDEDVRGQQQGDPRFGDIRFGAYIFQARTGGLDQTTLAQTAFPPPQGSTMAGDVQINTNLGFKVNGSSYDVYSVILHETGHSLGLNHPSNQAEAMYASYAGARSGLVAGDIAGIQAIYGARHLDGYQSYGVGLNKATAIDLTSTLAAAGRSASSWTSLAKIGDVEWFSFVAPSYAAGAWQATASSSNLSLLSPKITVYDTAGNSLGQASSPNSWGNTVTVSPQGIVAGTRYYIAVTGATNDVFDTGAYQLSVNLWTSPPPVTPPPVVVIPPVTPPVIVAPQILAPPTNAIVPDRYESNNTFGTATKLGRFNQGAVYGVSLNTAADVDYYSFQTAAAGVLEVAAAGTWVQVVNTRGGVLAQGNGVVSVSSARNATLIVRVQSANSAPLASYTMSITPKPTAPKQAGVVKVGGRTPSRPAPRVIAKSAPRIIARSAPGGGAHPANRILTRPAFRLARQEVSPAGPGGPAATYEGWRSVLRASLLG